MYPPSPQNLLKTQTKKNPLLTNLQYNPHALQFNSSFNPLLQSGVCVAPQLLHSAFTPPGAVEDVELGRLPFVPVPAPGVVAVEVDPAPPKVFDAEPVAEEGPEPEPEPEPEVDEDEDPDEDPVPLSPDIPNPAPFKAGTLPDLGLPAPLPPLPPLLLLPLALELPVKEER